MKRKYWYLTLLLLLNFCITQAQIKCNSVQIIMSFLEQISSFNYKPRLCDFNTFFDNDSEFEIILRVDSLKRNPSLILSWDDESRSLVIDRLLKNKTMKYLIDFRHQNKKKWIISKSILDDSDSLLFDIGVEGSNYHLQIQIANWPDAMKCKILDVLDSTGRSIIYNYKDIK